MQKRFSGGQFINILRRAEDGVSASKHAISGATLDKEALRVALWQKN